jgi:hypothetical protein
MPIDDGDKLDDGIELDAAIGEALVDLTGDGPDTGPEPVDYRWLAIGMRLGVERPDRARALVEMIEARKAGGHQDPDDAQESGSIPVASMLLVRAASLPAPDRMSTGPAVTFGWATRLAPGEILQLGRVVGDMLAGGSAPDIGKGFGIAWSGGVDVSRPELEAMMDEFTELEITVGGILASRDLRTGGPVEQPRGIAAWLGDWMPRRRPDEARAAEAIERSGEEARRGLVALWNVWMAMRYRSLIPAPTFDLLVHPWVTVVGPLPE